MQSKPTTTATNGQAAKPYPPLVCEDFEGIEADIRSITREVRKGGDPVEALVRLESKIAELRVRHVVDTERRARHAEYRLSNRVLFTEYGHAEQLREQETHQRTGQRPERIVVSCD